MKRLDWEKVRRRQRILKAGSEPADSVRVDPKGLGRKIEPKHASKGEIVKGRAGKFSHIKNIKARALIELAAVEALISDLAIRGCSDSADMETAKRKQARLKREIDPLGEYRERVGLKLLGKRRRKPKATNNA